MVRAEKLGMTLGRFLGEVSSPELTLWVAHDKTHNSETWQQTALLASMVASIFNDKPVGPDRFLPHPVETVEKFQTEAQIRAVMASMRRETFHGRD